jgi:hypothetical protein
MALLSGVLSRYVEQGYVAEGYVEGQPIEINSTTTSTGSKRISSGSVISVTSVKVTDGVKIVSPSNIVYTWDQCGSKEFSWDNWFLTQQTWEQKGLIVRGDVSVSAQGSPKLLGDASLEFTSSVGTTASNNLVGSSFIDTVITNTTDGSVLRDAQGLITGQSSVVALGGFLQSSNCNVTVNTTFVANGVTTLVGTASINNLCSVEADGDVNFIGNVTVPVTAVVEATGIHSISAGATINLGAVVITVGSATPVADPFRTATVGSETRKILASQETRTGIVQSESRVIIVPKETRTFTVDSETRKYKIPVPPFISNNVRSN